MALKQICETQKTIIVSDDTAVPGDVSVKYCRLSDEQQTINYKHSN